MNTRVRSKAQKEAKMEDQGGTKKRLTRRERKLALIQDVDKLKKKLRHEENVHKALERAINRPLGALPRLPPYLPPHTLELLAEVAVLEEEVVQLQKQVTSYQQGLYEEVVHIASKKNLGKSVSSNQLITTSNKQKKSKTGPQDEENKGLHSALSSLSRSASSRRLITSSTTSDQSNNCPNIEVNDNQVWKKLISPSEDEKGKENISYTNSVDNTKSQDNKIPSMTIPAKRPPRPQVIAKCINPPKSQSHCRLIDREQAQESSSSSSDGRMLEADSMPNKLSEDILNCLCSIFLRLGAVKDKSNESKAISSVFLNLNENNEKSELRDPYSIGPEFREREIGPYKHLHWIEAGSIDLNRKKSASFLINRLKILVSKLSSLDLEGLTHQQKLAFWINIYNSCMMNAFLEKGIPETPEKVIEVLQEATIIVSENLLNALTIEHFILRLPIQLRYASSEKIAKNDLYKAHAVFGLEWSEPLITFALSCGSHSSPAVRVYTASQVENQLEAAKRDYLQAAISISTTNKVIIPKLLDLFHLDFAKDLEGLLDWVCLQLPNELRNETIGCLESRKGRDALSQLVQIVPYDFSFRYLICR